MRRIYVYRVIGGNEQEAAKFKTRAQALAQSVIDVSDSTGAPQSRFYKFPEFDLMVRVQMMHCYLEIAVKNPPEWEFLSGMVDIGTTVAVGGSSACHQFYPSSEQATLENLMVRAFRNEKKLGHGPEGDKGITIGGVPLTQAGAVSSSLFTGKMRKVAQVALGLKKTVVEYDWRYHTSHGLYTQPAHESTNNKPVLWLIEISQAYGVLAMKLPIQKLKNSVNAIEQLVIEELGCIPTGKAFPRNSPGNLKLDQAVAAGTVKLLANAATLADYYGKSPFWVDSGWAFNYSGTEAQNTCWNKPNQFSMAYRYKVALDFDDAGVPVSAAMTEAESGFLFHAGEDDCRLQLPIESQKWQIATFYCHNGTDLTWPADNWESPIVAYYDGDTEIVYRQKTYGAEANGDTVDYSGLPSLSFSALYDASGFVFQNQNVTQVPMCMNEGGWGKTFRSDTSGAATGMIGYSGPGLSADWKSAWSSRRECKATMVPSSYYTYDNNPSNLNIVTMGLCPVYEQWLYGSGQKTKRSGICPAPGDREAVYVGSMITRTTQSTQYTRSESFWGSAYKQGLCYGLFQNAAGSQQVIQKNNSDTDNFINPFTGGTMANTAPYANWGFGTQNFDVSPYGRGSPSSSTIEGTFGYFQNPSTSERASQIVSTENDNTPSARQMSVSASEIGVIPCDPASFTVVVGQWPDNLGNKPSLGVSRSQFKGSLSFVDKYDNSGSSAQHNPADDEPQDEDNWIYRWVGFA